MKLLFDTYDTPDLPKKDVRKAYTDNLFELTRRGRETPAARVPPEVGQRRRDLSGRAGAAGPAVHDVHGGWHAGARDADLRVQGMAHQRRGSAAAERESADVVKCGSVRRGDTLSSIAARGVSRSGAVAGDRDRQRHRRSVADSARPARCRSRSCRSRRTTDRRGSVIP